MSFAELYAQARAVVKPRRLSPTAEAAGVGAALRTTSGRVYVGVCIDTACSMGFCAEHAAAAAMVTAGEHQVVEMIAVNWDGRIIPPCGRCREFISQLHPENRHALVKIGESTTLPLGDLLPHIWEPV
jgi:cytidine deaminase